MKIILIVSLAFLLSNIGFGQNQTVTSKQLSQQEIDKVFTKDVKNTLKIDYPIYRIYEYSDKLGKQFVVLTEHKIDCDASANSKECYNAVKAFCFSYKNEQLEQQWTLNDFILPNGNEVSDEYSISFWTKHFELKDYDGDGIVDPIVVYGTLGINGTDDGRVKIIIYQKDGKTAIRHQNSTMDGERNTQVDAAFYKLPTEIQKRVKEIMSNISDNGTGIFPAGWESAMDKKKLKFDEN